LQAGMGTTVAVLPDLEEISHGRMLPTKSKSCAIRPDTV
jgi:hypothetical protein